MLEAASHEFSSFFTLTYDDTQIPPNQSLDPSHCTLWLKRLRKFLQPENRTIRYFLVGEYGDQTNRPHYHAIIYGVSKLEADRLEHLWPYGFSYVGDLTPESAQYVAGYTTKKMTSKDDARLNGRYPEYARMSLKPGLGALGIQSFAESLTHPSALEQIRLTGDIPTHYHSLGRTLPLGRYLRRKIREEMGFENTAGQPLQIAIQDAEMLSMLADSGLSKKDFKEQKPFIKRQKILQIEGKYRIQQSKGKIL